MSRLNFIYIEKKPEERECMDAFINMIQQKEHCILKKK